MNSKNGGVLIGYTFRVGYSYRAGCSWFKPNNTKGQPFCSTKVKTKIQYKIQEASDSF
jgi:hypothetical protein